MLPQSIHSGVLSIPFRVAFKHASAERAATQAIWVELVTQNGVIGFGEGCPREYVSAETVETALEFVGRYQTEWLECIRSISALERWISDHGPEIDANPAAWTAVELAMLDALGKSRSCSLEVLLRQDELAGCFQYTAVLGDADPDAFQRQLAQYLKAGFRTFKVKLSGDANRDLAKVHALKAAGVAPGAVRADANNLWRNADSAIEHLCSLNFSFFAIEEPLGAGDFAGLGKVAEALATRIILDESLLREAQLQLCEGPAGRWIVNLRVSKMGGVIRSLRFLKVVRERGLSVIVGAHVGETSVLARAALTVARSASDILVAQEGAFGTHLLVSDVAEPPLMFGGGGVIDVVERGLVAQPGLGLNIHPRLL